MKRFCDLKVGDKYFEYFEGNIFEHEITEIENQYGNIYILQRRKRNNF